jgi:regulator of cell morphogenesis and NO signaling
MDMRANLDGELDDAAQHGEQSTEALIAHILERFHATHRRELPELYRLAAKVEAVHADHPECPAGLAAFLAETADELEDHMCKEEGVLFPTLLAGGGGCAPFALRRMRMEHEEHGRRLDELARLTRAFTAPDSACGSWRALYAGCAKLDADLRAHIALENDVLFARFE